MPGIRTSMATLMVAGFSACMFALSASAATADRKPVSHEPFTALLAEFVKPSKDGINRVDFAGMKVRGHGRLEAYLTKLEAARPSAMSPAPAPQTTPTTSRLPSGTTTKCPGTTAIPSGTR